LASSSSSPPVLLGRSEMMFASPRPVSPQPEMFATPRSPVPTYPQMQAFGDISTATAGGFTPTGARSPAMLLGRLDRGGVEPLTAVYYTLTNVPQSPTRVNPSTSYSSAGARSPAVLLGRLHRGGMAPLAAPMFFTEANHSPRPSSGDRPAPLVLLGRIRRGEQPPITQQGLHARYVPDPRLVQGFHAAQSSSGVPAQPSPTRSPQVAANYGVRIGAEMAPAQAGFARPPPSPGFARSPHRNGQLSQNTGAVTMAQPEGSVTAPARSLGVVVSEPSEAAFAPTAATADRPADGFDAAGAGGVTRGHGH